VSYAWLPGKKEISVQMQVKSKLRGVYYLPAPQLFVGDPSGLYHGINEIGKEQYLYAEVLCCHR
jgi:hypothetical protein